MDLDDDYIPFYYPYFGTAIHHDGFGGKVEFGSGTGYIKDACSIPKMLTNDILQKGLPK